MVWVAVGVMLALPAFAGFGDFFKGVGKILDGGDEPAVTENEIIRGLKEALEVGTGNIVTALAKADGYYKNPEIKIPLPGAVQKVEKLLRAAGFGDEVDAFELSMNRAAEQAAPEAKGIFLDAIKQMTFADARQILNGREDEATRYFREKTSGRLHEIFKPIAGRAMSEVGVTRAYQDLDASIKSIPFAGSLSFDLDEYVTDQALDGLFHMLAKEEARIRQDPQARVTELLRKVFQSK